MLGSILPALIVFGAMLLITVFGFLKSSTAAARREASNGSPTVTSRPPEWHSTAPAE